VSRRVAIWRDTDPDRCGLLHFVFEPDFGYRDYVEWALDVPLFFVVRDGVYRPGGGRTFRQLLQDGRDGEPATVDDWDLHLTTLFPEVRLKRIIEVRGADAVPRPMICALPALWKGLLYDAGAREAAWRLVADWSRDEREQAQLEVARHGLGARIAGRSALDWARELVAISSEGLRAIGEPAGSQPDERSFLEPLEEQIAIGKSPGEVVLDAWRGPWQASPQRLIEYARY